ncbi:septum formation initiator family protein [Candidatus Roizmanbacteria bacterium]|nr:septum formation initiator family protein [Candidatus Roizmanbacteria bacterium]
MKIVRNIIIIIFVVFLFSSLIRNLFDYRNKLQFYEDYKKENEKEKQQNTALKTEVLKKTSQSELEKTIRNKLNLLRPDEVAVMLPSPTPTPYVPTPTPLPNWLQWWKLFFK